MESAGCKLTETDGSALKATDGGEVVWSFQL